MRTNNISHKSQVKFNELPLSDDFMFGQVMRNERVCKLFLEVLLNKEIEKIVYLETQKDLKDDYESHGVRLDVFLKDEAGTVYNVEMQTTDKANLPCRARYYQSIIDRETLPKAADYRDIAQSYIIVICTFDEVGLGKAVYEKVSGYKDCEGVIYDDKSHVFFLNSEYKVGNASKPILDFLDLVRTNSFHAEPGSELLLQAQEMVKSVRTDKSLEVVYMTYQQKLYETRRENYAEGHAEGMEEGIQQANIAHVIKMHNKGRSDEYISEELDIPLNDVQDILLTHGKQN